MPIIQMVVIVIVMFLSFMVWNLKRLPSPVVIMTIGDDLIVCS